MAKINYLEGLLLGLDERSLREEFARRLFVGVTGLEDVRAFRGSDSIELVIGYALRQALGADAYSAAALVIEQAYKEFLVFLGSDMQAGRFGGSPALAMQALVRYATVVEYSRFTKHLNALRVLINALETIDDDWATQPKVSLLSALASVGKSREDVGLFTRYLDYRETAAIAFRALVQSGAEVEELAGALKRLRQRSESWRGYVDVDYLEQYAVGTHGGRLRDLLAQGPDFWHSLAYDHGRSTPSWPSEFANLDSIRPEALALAISLGGSERFDRLRKFEDVRPVSMSLTPLGEGVDLHSPTGGLVEYAFLIKVRAQSRAQENPWQHERSRDILAWRLSLWEESQSVEG